VHRSVVCSCQSAFVGVAEHVWESGTGRGGGGSSKTYSSICIRRGRQLSIDCRWSPVGSRADVYNDSEHDVTTAKYTPQTTTRCV